MHPAKPNNFPPALQQEKASHARPDNIEILGDEKAVEVCEMLYGGMEGRPIYLVERWEDRVADKDLP